MEKENIQKIPFNIMYRENIERGQLKVETVSGQPVRIICWDAKGSQRANDIIALVGSELGAENIQRYYSDGTLIADSSHHRNKDLVILLPSPKFKVGDTVVYRENIYEITGIARHNASAWTYAVDAVGTPSCPGNVACVIGSVVENEMKLFQPIVLSPFENALSEILLKYSGVKPKDERVKEFAEHLLFVAAKEYTVGVKWKKIKNVTTKRTEDNDCVTTETLLVKGWINDDDFRIVEPNCMVNREMLCIPVKELYNKLQHEDEE